MGASILVADDDRATLDALGREFEDLGYDVTLAANGSEAIEQIRKAEFDVVVSDIRMPGASGIEVLKATKQIAPDTEVVIATGYAEVQATVECLRGGAFDFVQKPLDLNDLLATVARALERRQLRATSALYEASQAILAASEPQRLPEVIVDVAIKVMAADDVSLMLPGPDNGLYIAHSRGLPPEHRTEVIAFGERVAGRVAASRQPALISAGLATDPRFADVQSFGRVHSSIVYPLVRGERLVGVLNISRAANARPFRKQDVERASVLASQVLLALENRGLLHQVAASERLAAVGQLASGVAHEINNPVACVLAGLAYLRDRLEDLSRLDSLLAEGADLEALRSCRDRLGGKAFMGEVRQAVGEAEEGAIRIRDIVRDMRSLGRGEDEKPATVDLNDAIRSALRLANAEIRFRATVVARLGPDVQILGSAGRLSQVFVNLIVNAAQAIGERPGQRSEIVVTSRRSGDRVVAEVSDSGPGIRPEHLPRLFETFFTTKEAATGTGLGLSISREIVRRHGGELKVQSSFGSGATFTLDFPAAKAVHAARPGAEAAEATRSAIPRADGRPSRFRMLFIDDEPSILRAYERSFGRDHEVVLAEGGEQALGILARRQDFNLVVCDLLMPDVGGMEVYRRVREAHPGLDGAFVFVTDGVTRKDVEAFVRTVGNQVLEKPFDFGSLREIIEVRSRGLQT